MAKKRPELPDNQIRVVGLQESDAWKLEILETPHSWFYMISARAFAITPQGTVQPWVFSPSSIGIVKPEWQAHATRVTGEAAAEVQGKVARALQPPPPCTQCGGRGEDDDGKPCWKCLGGK